MNLRQIQSAQINSQFKSTYTRPNQPKQPIHPTIVCNQPLTSIQKLLPFRVFIRSNFILKYCYPFWNENEVGSAVVVLKKPTFLPANQIPSRSKSTSTHKITSKPTSFPFVDDFDHYYIVYGNEVGVDGTK
jgi:hypothetical protein